MKPSPSAEPKSLTTLVQDLPKELFDEVFELVTQVGSDEVITITKAYRHPIVLQISSTIRREKAKIYHTTNKFTADTDVRDGEDKYSAAERYNAADKYMRKWLRNLPWDYRNMIKEIRIPSWNEALATLEEDWRSLTLRETQVTAIREMNRLLYYWHHVLEGAHLPTLNSILRVDLEIVEEKMVWMNWRELYDFHSRL